MIKMTSMTDMVVVIGAAEVVMMMVMMMMMMMTMMACESTKWSNKNTIRQQKIQG